MTDQLNSIPQVKNSIQNIRQNLAYDFDEFGTQIESVFQEIDCYMARNTQEISELREKVQELEEAIAEIFLLGKDKDFKEKSDVKHAQ